MTRIASIILATSNPHKIEEVAAIFVACAAAHPGFPSLGVEGLGDAAKQWPEPVEDADTFEANAAIKARYYADRTGQWCIADDSGLEVDALGGAPGVRSARYAGITGPRNVVDPANNRRLLAELGDLPAERRTARFVCAMALCRPGGVEPVAIVRGEVHGRILGPGDAGYSLDGPAGRGAHGFGYDPLFLLPERGKTTAELRPAEKNAISHRGQAARAMWHRVQALR